MADLEWTDSLNLSLQIAPAAPMPSYANEEDEEVMKSRMELADLAIKRQREKKAKEKELAAEASAEGDEDDGGGKVCFCGFPCLGKPIECGMVSDECRGGHRESCS